MTTNETQSAHPTFAQVMKECRQTIIEHLPVITKVMIGQAEEGSCQHAKFLFDLVDTAPAKPAEEESLPGPSLAETLLERLQIVEAQDAAEEMGSGSGVIE
jgi:hypothetical protein